MRSILDFLTSVEIMSLASDPRVLIATAFVALLAVAFRWKSVLVVLLGVGGTMAVVRWSRAGVGSPIFDRGFLVFTGGTILLGFILIYFLFIKGD